MLKRYPGIIKQSHCNSVFSSYFCVSSSFSALMMQFHLCSHLCAWSSAHPTQTLSGHTCWKVGQEQFQNQMTVKAGTVPTTSTSEKKRNPCCKNSFWVLSTAVLCLYTLRLGLRLAWSQALKSQTRYTLGLVMTWSSFTTLKNWR